MAKKIIYYLHSCDEWVSKSSMRLIFIGTSPTKLKMKISKEIEAGNMEYYDAELSPKEQAKMFRQDFAKKTENYINGNLTYGFYDYCYDNEEL